MRRNFVTLSRVNNSRARFCKVAETVKVCLILDPGENGFLSRGADFDKQPSVFIPVIFWGKFLQTSTPRIFWGATEANGEGRRFFPSKNSEFHQCQMEQSKL
jgi:hypothetical protein